MTQFTWHSAPSSPQKPPCHGSIRVYEPASRECRQCLFANSCRDKIENDRRMGVAAAGPMNAQPNPWAPQWNTIPPQQPVNRLQQAPPAYAPQSGYAQPAYSPMGQRAPVQVQQVNTQMQPTYSETYGRFNDPLYYVLAANPVPMRYQMPGESFVERVVKNAMLNFAERMFAEAFLAIRQMVMPLPPVQQVIVKDVTPPEDPNSGQK